jgi:hypothetical protein
MASLAFRGLGLARRGAALARRPLQTIALDAGSRGAFLASASRRGWARHDTRDAVAKQFRFDNFSAPRRPPNGPRPRGTPLERDHSEIYDDNASFGRATEKLGSYPLWRAGCAAAPRKNLK